MNFSLITATLFSLIALLQVLRPLRGWQVTIGDVVVPLWISWIGLTVATYLAYQGFIPLTSGGTSAQASSSRNRQGSLR